MTQFNFKLNSTLLVTVHDISRLSNKKVLQIFEEALTQHAKLTLLNELADIRQELDDSNTIIEYDLNTDTSEFNIRFVAPDSIAELIECRLNK